MPATHPSGLARFKPATSRRTLLLGAGCAWTLAGGILLTRALTALIAEHRHLAAELLIGLLAGSAFYLLLFTRISRRHITRIEDISVDNPCFFSFFNLQSYLMMFVMIGTGITLRRLDLINHGVLYTVYIAMGLPLLLSARRFFVSWVRSRPTV